MLHSDCACVSLSLDFLSLILFADILYNEKGQFKLTDFGIISDWKDRSDQQAMAEAKTFVGTLLYMSPERIGGQPYSYACDIWSMALALLTCRVGEFAIPHNSHWELVNSIQSGPAILNCQ
jgi:serine/threonine protein kinase